MNRYNGLLFVMVGFFFGLSACSDPGDLILLGPEHRLELTEAESQLPRNQEYIDHHNECCNKFPDVQIPLYRVIGGENYHYYLAIPMEANPNLIAELFLSAEDVEFQLESKTENMQLIRGQTEEKCLNIYLVDLPSGDFFMFSLISEDITICEKHLNKEWINSRIEKM